MFQAGVNMSKRFKNFNGVVNFISIELMKYGIYTKEKAIERARQLTNLPTNYYYTLDMVERIVIDKAIKNFPNFARSKNFKIVNFNLSY